MQNGRNEESRKKDLLFLHGYLSCSQSFAYQIPFFKKDFNVYAPNLKGFGDNKKMPFPYSLDDYVKEITDYIAENNLVRPHVIAHSFGGRIALKAAYNNPLLFDKIALVSAAGLKPKFSLGKSVKKCVYKMIKPIFGEKRLMNFFSSDYRALSPLMRESFKKIVNENLDYTLDKIQNKTLIIFGEDDRETPVYMAEKFHANIKNSELSIIKDAGHFSFIDKPVRFNTEVREFLLSQ